MGRFPSLPRDPACPQSFSLCKMPDLKPGPLTQYSGALPKSHHISWLNVSISRILHLLCYWYRYTYIITGFAWVFFCQTICLKVFFFRYIFFMKSAGDVFNNCSSLMYFLQIPFCHVPTLNRAVSFQAGLPGPLFLAGAGAVFFNPAPAPSLTPTPSPSLL